MTTKAQMVMEILQSKDLIQVDEIMGIPVIREYGNAVLVSLSEQKSETCMEILRNNNE